MEESFKMVRRGFNGRKGFRKDPILAKECSKIKAIEEKTFQSNFSSLDLLNSLKAVSKRRKSDK
jgi:hypothetical protein